MHYLNQLWRVIRNRMATKDNLSRGSTLGVMCDEKEETLSHLFLKCSIVKAA